MNVKTMNFSEILNNFRAKNVEFVLKDGSTRTIFVEEIENEEDDQPEIIFMGSTEDILISDIVSAKEVNSLN